MADTTIRCSEETADRLYARKQRRESYEDVIVRLLDRVAQQPAVDDQRLRAQVDGLDWSQTEYAKTGDRVAALTAMAAELAAREIAGKQALRRVVIRRGHDIDDSTLRRLSSDLLPLLDEVRAESQVYEWQ